MFYLKFHQQNTKQVRFQNFEEKTLGGSNPQEKERWSFPYCFVEKTSNDIRISFVHIQCSKKQKIKRHLNYDISCTFI